MGRREAGGSSPFLPYTFVSMSVCMLVCASKRTCIQHVCLYTCKVSALRCILASRVSEWRVCVCVRVLRPQNHSNLPPRIPFVFCYLNRNPMKRLDRSCLIFNLENLLYFKETFPCVCLAQRLV